MEVANDLKKIWYSNFLEKYHPKDIVSDHTFCENTKKSNICTDKVSISGKTTEDTSTSPIDEYLALKSHHRRRLVRRLAET